MKNMGEAEKTRSEPIRTMRLAVRELQLAGPLVACLWAADSESMRNHDQRNPKVSGADPTLKDPYERECRRAFV